MDDAATIDAFARDEGLPAGFAATAERLHAPLADRIADWAAAPRTRPLVVGLCAPQGAGKSTLVGLAVRLLAARGLAAVGLSIDDLYLTRASRQDLARRVSPLLAVRGVPGTHDPALGLTVLEALGGCGPTTLPRFDKAADDRAPRAAWPRVAGPVDVVLLEGWCVGARPQPAAALAAPVNALEQDEDPDGAWRGYANAALAGPYAALFARLDRRVLLTAPDFATVRRWRGEQEARLRTRLAADGRDPALAMDEAALDRFVAHYERLTLWIAEDLPRIADLVIALDADRAPINPLAASALSSGPLGGRKAEP